MQKGVTMPEMLLAVGMSQYYELPLVHFIPPYRNYTKMLVAMRGEGYIEPTNDLKKHYKLTVKGRNYLIIHDCELFIEEDKAIDNFIDTL